MSLTAGQISHYREHGYLVLERYLDEVTVAGLRAAIVELNDAARTVAASNAVYDIGPGHRPDSPKVRRVKHPHLRHPAFNALMRSVALVDPVADLLGGSVRFDHAKLNFKPPGAKAAVEWHQDWAFYPHTNDDLLAVGVMVEDCGKDNGPLMVIPGSHRGPVFDHHRNGTFIGALDPAELGDARKRAVALTGPAGSISIHHVRTVHGSRENESDSRRPLLLFSYAAVDAFPVYQRPDLAEFDARILRGVPTREARQTAVPVRIPYPRDPAADSIFDNQQEVQGRSFGNAAEMT